MRDVNTNKYCILFFDKSSVYWSKFLKRFKHCALLVFDELQNTVLFYGLQTNKIIMRTSVCNSFDQYIEHLLNIKSLVCYLILEVHKPSNKNHKLVTILTCNELVRISTGINVGFTLTPNHLYKKICLNISPNYTIIQLWNRK